ncbi:MAG: protein kinase [Labilithrix sp.]|nr:protein kinase [Labilithrix sp.]MCW5836474.1 protein kinase [Labilithrix sp.]
MAGPADEKPNAPTATPKGLVRAPASVRPPAKPGPKSLIGSTISERYKIERLLGEGGMGAVYQAEHTLMRKRMAIKVLHPEMTRLPEVVARFEREAMAAAHIDHPHVVTATDFGKLEDGSFFLALEFVEGKSLREVIALGRLELGRALHIGRQIAAALSRAHALKIVHRDLKPENVMLVERDGDPDFVKVLDFGIAKVQIGELTAGDVSQAGPGQPVLTQAGMVYGTPEYMAPEQALGQPVDARADLYALGCIVYEMLCGVRPFDAESKVALLGMQVTAPMPPMATKAPDANVPPEVEALVKRLLAKEASERLGDARELIDGITTVMSQLAATGRIDAVYAPPPASRLGTNPGIISGIGPAPDLSGVSPTVAAAAPSVPPKAGEGFLAGKAWMIAAGGGLIGILVLVATILIVLKGGEPAVDGEAGVSPREDAGATLVAPPPSTEQKITEAIGQIDNGNYGSGIRALEGLGPEAQGREDVHRALFTAYGKTGRPAEAMREVGLVLKANPALDLLAADNIVLRQEVRNTALLEGQPSASKAAVEEAWSLLTGRLGHVGLDDLYDIAYGRSGMAPGYHKARDRAQREVVKADRAKMSPALAVTVDLHAAGNNCGAVKALLERAAENGDERTLAVLRPLTAPRLHGSGWKKQDLLGCVHEGSLNRTIAELEARLRKR